MIAKAPENGKRGSNTGGLLRYLFGKGRANEHTNPHLVAAWDPEWLDGGAFAQLVGQRGWLPRLARDIDAAMTGHEVHLAKGHVYHVVLSVPRADGQLGDEVWRALVEEAIEHMGFGPDANGASGCRWVAVHHGLSVEGNDHVHLVINLVRGDGTIANTYRDWPRWRSWCLAVEERLNLTGTAPAGAGRKATSRAELESAAKTGARTDRQRLTQLVAEAAAVADNEIEFLAKLRRANVLYKPHLSGREVTGYAVAINKNNGDPEPLWFAGSTLRRDLSLPRVRARWDDPGPRWEHLAEQFWNSEQVMGFGLELRTRTAWKEVTGYLNAVVEQDIAAEGDRWNQTVGQVADFVAVLAQFDSDPDRMQRAADHLAGAAQLERGQVRPQPRQPGIALPLLVAAARTAAICKDPAPLILAAVVLLVWSIVKALQRAADDWRPQPRVAARQDLAAAANELADHPILRAPEPAAQASTRKPKPSAPASPLDFDRQRGVHSPTAAPRMGGRAR